MFERIFHVGTFCLSSDKFGLVLRLRTADCKRRPDTRIRKLTVKNLFSKNANLLHWFNTIILHYTEVWQLCSRSTVHRGSVKLVISSFSCEMTPLLFFSAAENKAMTLVCLEQVFPLVKTKSHCPSHDLVFRLKKNWIFWSLKKHRNCFQVFVVKRSWRHEPTRMTSSIYIQITAA